MVELNLQRLQQKYKHLSFPDVALSTTSCLVHKCQAMKSLYHACDLSSHAILQIQSGNNI